MKNVKCVTHVKNVTCLTCEKCHICHMCRVIQCDSFCSWFIILNVIGLRFTALGAFTLLLGTPPPQGCPSALLQGCLKKEGCVHLCERQVRTNQSIIMRCSGVSSSPGILPAAPISDFDFCLKFILLLILMLLCPTSSVKVSCPTIREL